MHDSLTFIKHSSTEVLIISKIEINILTHKKSFSYWISVSLLLKKTSKISKNIPYSHPNMSDLITILAHMFLYLSVSVYVYVDVDVAVDI